MEFATCRYNPNHKNIKKTRLMIHEFNCPDKNDLLKCCSYNPSHKFHISKISHHEQSCPDKPKADPIDDDIRAYVKKPK